MMVVSSIEVTHYLDMNFCKLWYELAMAVVYCEAECLDIDTERLEMRNMLESIAKFDRNMCYGNILKMFAEHNYFWNWEQV